MSRQYKGILKERKQWVNIALCLVALYIAYIQFMRGNLLYVMFALIVAVACFFKKEYIIDEDGVDIKFTLFGMVRHNLWPWEEITTLHTDHKRAKPDTMLHIGKDIVTRSFVLSPSDCQAAINLAREKNPSIYIENPTAEEQAMREAEILHRQEVERAQKRARKKKK